MALLDIFTTQVKNKANELARYRTEEEDIMRKIRILMNSLSEFWKGESMEALVANFNEKQVSMEEMLRLLQQFSDLANEAADKAVSIDQQLAGMLRAVMR